MAFPDMAAVLLARDGLYIGLNTAGRPVVQVAPGRGGGRWILNDEERSIMTQFDHPWAAPADEGPPQRPFIDRALAWLENATGPEAGLIQTQAARRLVALGLGPESHKALVRRDEERERLLRRALDSGQLRGTRIGDDIAEHFGEATSASNEREHYRRASPLPTGEKEGER